MARTPSQMVPLGTPAPDFSLLDTVSGKTLSLADLRGAKVTCIMFICNHCPYVLQLNAALVQVATAYSAKGVSFVGISANDAVAYPQDAPDKMTAQAAAVGYPFPYLYDATQAVATAYNAACTPDFFVYDADLHLAYRGQFDGARPSNDTPVTGASLRAALDALLAGTPVPTPQLPSLGCNIKWKQA